MLKFIKDNNLAERGDRIGIALSGGPDSMALLHCFNNFKDRGHFDICAVHLEHGIRGENSKADARFVSEQCAELKVPLYSESADVPTIARTRKISVESAGRQIREKLFKRIVKEGKADYIATAHHADDNAESVLMHILRGSGLNGLTGIKARRGFLIRPFLAVKKAEILKYISERNILFREDESNKYNDYRRNYVRNVLMNSAKSVFGDVTDSLNRLSKFANEDNDFIEKEADKALYECVEISGNRAVIDIEKLTAYHKAVASRVIIRALYELGIENDLEASHIDAVMNLAKTRETGKGIRLLKELGAWVEYGKLIIYNTGKELKSYSYKRRKNLGNTNNGVKAVLPGRTELANGDVLEARMIETFNRDNNTKYCECFDFDKLPSTCVIRRFKYEGGNSDKPGDIIHPLGAPGRKKLNRYYSDKKIPERQRGDIPVLADENNIIWAIGVGISEAYKIDKNTKNIILLKYLRKDQQS